MLQCQPHRKKFSIKAKIRQIMLKIETRKNNLAKTSFLSGPYDLSDKYSLS